jgi:hypothetical protein
LKVTTLNRIKDHPRPALTLPISPLAQAVAAAGCGAAQCRSLAAAASGAFSTRCRAAFSLRLKATADESFVRGSCPMSPAPPLPALQGSTLANALRALAMDAVVRDRVLGTALWARWLGPNGSFVGVTSFGASAPGEVL